MKELAKYVLILLLSVTSYVASSQEYLKKHLENIKPSVYGGDVQIWDIENGNEEYMFFATGTALSVWDGTRWESFVVKDRYFRSLCYDSKNRRLYCAGNNFFGYWTQNSFGSYEYTELFYSNDIAAGHIFWRSVLSGSQVYFQTHENIFRYDVINQKIEQIALKGYVNYIHKVDNMVYVQIDSKFYEIAGLELRALPIEIDSRVVNVCRQNGALYLFSETKGVFIYENGNIRNGDLLSNEKLIKSRVFSASAFDENHFLLGTVLEGLYVVDRQGKILRQYSEEQSMEYTTVLSLATDSLRNIWIGLDGGIAKIDANPRQGYYNSWNKKIGSVYSIYYSYDKLFVGTNKGLYTVTDGSEPTFILGTEGQVWDIKHINNEILVCHDKGLLRVVNDKVIENIYPSAWNLIPVNGKSQLYYSADNKGFAVYTTQSGRLEFKNRIENYSKPFNNSFIDKYGNMWINGFYGAVKKLTLDNELTKVEKETNYNILTEKENWIGISFLDGDIVFFCDNRCYTYNINSDNIEPNSYYTSLFEAVGNSVTTISQSGNYFFFISNDDVGIIERRGDEFINKGLIFRPTKDKMIPVAFRNFVNTYDGKVAMGYVNGVAFYDSKVEDNTYKYPIRLKRIEYIHRGEKQSLDLSQFPHIPAIENGSVNIKFLLNNISQDGIVYISMDDEPWHGVRVNEEIEYPYINSGKHSLRIKRSMQFEHQIEINFEIKPPFTESIWFWGIITLVVISIFLIVYRIHSLRLSRIRKRIFERQNELLEKEKMNFENQKLSLEVKDRDKRLTSFAMNSIRFNNALNDIQSDITDVKTSDPVTKGQIRSILRKITSYRRSEDNWAVFEKYFNNVYDGFFDKLTVNYPNLTQNDLKIAAYIKLGLSTKEIAVLMNIAPGSVDTARHRLRKNLELPLETSLSKFLSNI